MKVIKASQVNPLFLLFIAAIMWSFCGVMLKFLHWNPIAIASGRSFIAAIIVFFIMKEPKFTWSTPQLGAAIAYAVMVIMYVVANKYTTAANAIILQYTCPIYAAILGALFLKEKVKFIDCITITAVFSGMIACFWGSGLSGNLFGDLCGILSGFSYAVMTIFLRMQKDASPLESLFLGNIIMTLAGLPFIFSQHIIYVDVFKVIMLGVLQGCPFIFYSMGLKKVRAVEASLITSIEPILNPLWVFIGVGEVPKPLTIVGGAMVLLSIIFRTWYTNRRQLVI